MTSEMGRPFTEGKARFGGMRKSVVRLSKENRSRESSKNKFTQENKRRDREYAVVNTDGKGEVEGPPLGA
jgi:hypothetical protein